MAPHEGGISLSGSRVPIVRGLVTALLPACPRTRWRREDVEFNEERAAALRDRLGAAASRSWAIPVALTNRDEYAQRWLPPARARVIRRSRWPGRTGRRRPAEDIIAEALGPV